MKTDQNNGQMMPYDYLKHCLHAEVIGSNHAFTWGRALRRYLRNRHIRYQMKWRIASCLHATGGRRRVKLASWINERISQRHNVQIELGAQIGPGLKIVHHSGIVISRLSRIGADFTIHQNTTIGAKVNNTGTIVIGDGVTICAHCCVIGLDLTIGSFVTIGADTFINKDIPPGVTCYSRREVTFSGIRRPEDGSDLSSGIKIQAA